MRHANLAGLSGSPIRSHDRSMLDPTIDSAHHSGTRPILTAEVLGAEERSTALSFEGRMARSGMPEAERRAVRRGVAHARACASDAGEVAAAAAGVHAELRRVFGDEIRPRA